MADTPAENIEAPQTPQTREPPASSTFKKWNRKVHIYLGLYMLLFLWIFSLSGLFMNHPMWFVGRPNRTPIETKVAMPESGTRLEKAWDIMEQLDLRGEVYFLREPAAGTFGFLSMRPNVRNFVTVTLETGATKISRVKASNHPAVSTLNQLHVFTGMLGERERDWLPTKIWSFCMDALCAGVIVMVLSSLYMAWKLKANRAGALASFTLGMIVFAYFVWGQAWMT